jgi:hypothetical protein
MNGSACRSDGIIYPVELVGNGRNDLSRVAEVIRVVDVTQVIVY